MKVTRMELDHMVHDCYGVCQPAGESCVGAQDQTGGGELSESCSCHCYGYIG